MTASTKKKLTATLTGYGFDPKPIQGLNEVSEPDLSWMEDDEVMEATESHDEFTSHWAQAEAYARGLLED